MKITDEARDVLKQVFDENNANGLLVSIQETCCGKSPVFQVAILDDEDPKDEINGINVSAGKDEKEVIDDMIIDFVNGELVVLNSVCGCGDGGCGHHDHDHEGGCCHHE